MVAVKINEEFHKNVR